MRVRPEALVSLSSVRQKPWYQALSQTMNMVGAVPSNADAYTQYLHLCVGYAVAHLDEATRYKPEGRGFDFR